MTGGIGIGLSILILRDSAIMSMAASWGVRQNYERRLLEFGAAASDGLD